MPKIIFSHPEVDKLLQRNRTPGGQQIYKGDRVAIHDNGMLYINTGADAIRWSYNLNTMTYPTFGGEVVQILSANIGDLNVTGTTGNYSILEDIYLWFMVYMSIATQGWRDSGTSGHNEDPVTMWYPVREWLFKIRPKTLPGFRLATDVVAPSWQITASVVQGDPDAEALTLTGAIAGLNEIHAGIGYTEFNPFSMPSDKDTYQSMSDQVGKYGSTLGDVYNQFSSGDYSAALTPYMSGPAKPSNK